MLELRTYTLASDEALQQYADVHWARHIASLAGFGVTTHRVWKHVGTDQPRLTAIVEYDEGLDPKDVTRRYMGSAEFRSDMEGFVMSDILDVASVFVEPASTDPVGGPGQHRR